MNTSILEYCFQQQQNKVVFKKLGGLEMRQNFVLGIQRQVWNLNKCEHIWADLGFRGTTIYNLFANWVGVKKLE